MTRRQIEIGTIGNDGTGDSIRDAFRKVNENFRELYSSLGLGDRLSFRGLDETPDSYSGQENALLAVNNTETGIVFKQLVAGTGVQLDFTANANEIEISTLFASISGDPNPQLGGNLSARSGAAQYRILDLGTNTSPLSPVYKHEAVNKSYADGKISLGGISAVDPATGLINPTFGTMTGALILSRDPEPLDDEVHDGLIAATKRYVDGSAFGSLVNLYVAKSGSDERTGVSPALQGRALAYAYKTLEAALKRAEELILESRQEIGPYKKVLTYNQGQSECTLSNIITSPDSGTGFIGQVFMSVDTVVLSAPGTNYRVGDIISISGGTGTAATIEVLSTIGNPGAVLSFKLISGGIYSVLPGTTNVVTGSNSQFGGGARFNIKYKVNNISVINGGIDYGLVSVRITPAVGDTAGSGAFGSAEVVNGAVVSITVSDPGSNFSLLPIVSVDLPRFKIYTGGLRTDFTGNVISPDPAAVRTRDIREGLFLRGETSGALAQILGHTGALDGNDELFDVDIKYGSFQLGETISYGDVTLNTQISVLVESGIYEENYPLRIPQNVAIIGDEFRRVIIRPKPGESSSPWAFLKFRRDTRIDGLETAEQLFGYHYLADPTIPVYPAINNKGSFTSAATLISLNKTFLQQETIAWIDNQIFNNIGVFFGFDYDTLSWSRDIGLLVDAIIFDSKYGGYSRTVSTALKYKSSDNGLTAITTQLSQTTAALTHLNELITAIIANTEITPKYNLLKNQIIDLGYVAELGSGDVINDLFSTVFDVISNSGSVNYPKNNDNLDVFLCNDAVIVRAVTMQGHGGFSMVLDPEGQILAKSPYAQECASFSKSNGRQRFAGGMFVDGFTGNLQFRLTQRVVVGGIDSNTRFKVSGLVRSPNLPASFIVNDSVYRINYVRDFVYSPNGSTAQFVLDETTPFTYTIGPRTISVSTGNPGTFTCVNHKLEQGAVVVFVSSATLPQPLVTNKEYYVIADSLTLNSFRISVNPNDNIGLAITTSGSGTITFERIYEVLMPGNRSMLSNDFTQIADLGYGLLVTNGALTEAVSMFTYYCHISYYSLNGGQIRSISGSSAHGNYALVAEGSDPLEIPTPVTLFYDLSQGAKCYYPNSSYANLAGQSVIYVYNYTYIPLAKSELEIIHTDGSLVRYVIGTVSTVNLPSGVAEIRISTADGLTATVPNNTPLSIRNNGQVILTGDVVNVATRPSTALVLNESSNVYRILQFEDYPDPAAATTCTIANGSPAVVTSTGHGLLANYIVTFTTSGSLPSPLQVGIRYYVLEDGLSSNTFRIARSPNGTAINTTSSGSGIHSFKNAALARTTLRENYDYIELTVAQPNEYVAGSTKNFSVTTANPAVFSSTAHGLAVGDVVRLSSTGNLPTGLSNTRHYFVISTGWGLNSFQLSDIPGGAGVEVTAAGTGTYSVGKVKGRVGDNSFYVVAVGPNDVTRLTGYKFVWCGFEYTVTQYDSPTVTGIEGIARITLNRALQLDALTGTGNVLTFQSPPTLKAGVPKRTSGAAGTLTIRISLTRVTSHDLLEIGTGSYADTNYPNEIYGPSVNPAAPAQETEERGSGRTFYVTTDQFGNFSVGPYFRVDQGTGSVTFSAAIALSNLDGLGFRIGVAIKEFSTDTAMSENATDKVPVQSAIRTYVDRRLGQSQTGDILPLESRLPAFTGGYMALDGTLPMIGNINLDSHRIVNLANPQAPTDAVNLRSLVLANLQDSNFSNVRANDLVVFTGVGNELYNATVVGDISLNIDSTAHTIDAQINAGSITNADVNASAAITQSKLSMSAAGIRANAAGITQADRGLASFNSGQFTATDGWVSIKDNGIILDKLEQISSKTVLGNAGISSANVSSIPFSSVVDVGGAIKKSQFSGVGFLRRNDTLSNSLDANYSIVQDDATLSTNTLVRRDNNGDFAARTVTLQDLKLKLSTELSSYQTLARISSVSGGTTRLYGFLGNGGVYVGNGSIGSDNSTFYDNDSHEFRTQNGFNPAPISCGQVTTQKITTGGSTTQGTITGQWILADTPGGSTRTNSRLQATYAADLAEFYEGDQEYEVGTVLVFGGNNEVTIATSANDSKVAGVVSDNAAYSMYGACPGLKNQVALQGRVPCKVVGKISKGDTLVTSNIPGVAIKNLTPKPGTIIGKALQEYDSDHIGTIEVAVGRT